MISKEEFICQYCAKNIPLHNKKLHEVRCLKERNSANNIGSNSKPILNNNFNNSEGLSAQISERNSQTNQYSNPNSSSRISNIYSSNQILEDQLNFDNNSNSELNRNLSWKKEPNQQNQISENSYPTYIDKSKFKVVDKIPNDGNTGSRIENIQSKISGAMDMGQKEKIFSICPKCNDVVMDENIIDHMNNCSYKTCRYCFEYYPEEIIKDHLSFCEKNPQKKNYEDAIY